MSVTAGVSDTVIAIRDKLRGKIGQTKVRRYWPGKAPEWGTEAGEEDDLRTARAAALAKAFPTHDDSDDDDPRLRRLAESRSANRDEIRADHLRFREAEIVSTEEEENRRAEGLDLEEEEDDDALEEKRRLLREKALKKLQKEAEEAILEAEEEEGEEPDDEDEEEAEYGTASEGDYGTVAMFKPVFVPEAERETIAEREKLEAKERTLEEAEKRKLEHRKIETRQVLVEMIREEGSVQKNIELEADIGDVDTDDELNEVDEYEAWKTREMARLKRDREERVATMKLREEIERVRKMSEDERREWERKKPKPAKPLKVNRNFMQRYYHKGSFYQTEADDSAATARTDSIYQRDFSAPTGEDKLDKTILPKVMQVKHFGRSGRTKWTHLVNEDTTDWNSPWTYSDPLRAKYNAKMAALNAPIAKPKGNKKLKVWDLR